LNNLTDCTAHSIVANLLCRNSGFTGNTVQSPFNIMRTLETNPLLDPLGNDRIDHFEGYLMHPDPINDDVHNHIGSVTITKKEYATTESIESVVIEFWAENHDKNFELHISMDKGRARVERMQS